jgi:hypothetical protein
MFQNQSPFQWPGTPAGQPAQPNYGQPQQTPTQAQPAPGNIAPAGAGSPVPMAGYGAPQPGYGQPGPSYPIQGPGYAPPAPTFGDPFAAVATASLKRGEKLFYKGKDLVLAEVLKCKLHNGQKGVALIVETRVLWSALGTNAVGSEPGVVIKQGFYFGSEVKTWMCALLGLVASRDQAEIAKIDAAQGQWSQLCSLACASPDGQLQGPGPFAGTIVLLDAWRKRKVDRFGNPKVLTQGEDPEMDLVRPEAVAQNVGDSLKYLATCANPAQDPRAEQHYGIVKAALERRLDVPAYDPNALAARIQAMRSAPAQTQAPAQGFPGQPGFVGR